MPPGWPSPINNSGLSLIKVPAGYTGSIGYVGSAGSGYTGSQGIQGPIGPPDGYTGSQGITGYTGSAGANATKTAVVQYITTSSSLTFNYNTNTTHQLTVLAFNNIGGSLSNNEITLPPGTYHVDGLSSLSFYNTRVTSSFIQCGITMGIDVRSTTGTIYMPKMSNYYYFLGYGTQTFDVPVPIKGIFTLTNTTTVVVNMYWSPTVGSGTWGPINFNPTSGLTGADITFTQL
jgi:hypothetical protein